MAAASSLRSNPGSSSQEPNADALYEILLRVRPKDLGRCHAVCRPWRCILTDPHFIAAHKARHDPLVVVGYIMRGQSTTLCDIMDLSGRVLKQVNVAGSWLARSVYLDFICASGLMLRIFRLLNLSSGAVYDLPEELSEELAAEGMSASHFFDNAALGQAKSTGQYKVLRVLDPHSNDDHKRQLFEISTLGGGSHAQWRAKEAPPYSVTVGMWKPAVFIDGIFYFLCVEPVVRAGDVAMEYRVASFDLETEEWRPTLPGPLSSSVDYVPPQTIPRVDNLILCDINDCLVAVHRTLLSLVELWYLVDLERGLWVKKHSIPVQFRHILSVPYTVRPLVELSDGRIVLVQARDEKVSLIIHDPKTNTCSDVAEMENCFAVGLYTRGLLGLADGASQ